MIGEENVPGEFGEDFEARIERRLERRIARRLERRLERRLDRRMRLRAAIAELLKAKIREHYGIEEDEGDFTDNEFSMGGDTGPLRSLFGAALEGGDIEPEDLFGEEAFERRQERRLGRRMERRGDRRVARKVARKTNRRAAVREKVADARH
ncbi:hypothetical protein D3C87_189450 [compost metagenome]